MSSDVSLEVLRRIQRADPEGKPEEPTEETRDRFKRWVIDEYGAAVWRAYATGGWDPRWTA